jgi:hypothetical protein
MGPLGVEAEKALIPTGFEGEDVEVHVESDDCKDSRGR